MIFDILPKADLVPGSELLIRGPYGLQPIYTFGEGDILQLRGQIFGVIGDYRDATYGRYKLIVIQYKNSVDARSVFTNLLINLDPYLTLLDQSKNHFSFKDFQDKFGLVELNKDVMQIRIKLDKKPVF